MALERVDRIIGDQCQYGAEDGGGPVKKPSGFMTNSGELRKALGDRCQGRGGMCGRRQGGQHVVCSGRVARKAAVYPL